MIKRPINVKPQIDQRSQCDGKRSYNTYRDAENAYKAFGRRVPANIFKCCFCGSFHIGHNNGKKKKLKVRGGWYADYPEQGFDV